MPRGPRRRPRFATTTTALTIALTAKTFSQLPSALLGLESGSPSALALDTRLALRLAALEAGDDDVDTEHSPAAPAGLGAVPDDLKGL